MGPRERLGTFSTGQPPPTLHGRPISARPEAGAEAEAEAAAAPTAAAAGAARGIVPLSARAVAFVPATAVERILR